MSIKTEKMLEVLVKLTALVLAPTVEERKRSILKSEKAFSAYKLCDGLTTISEIVEKSDYSTRSVEDNLPLWEKMGILISIGHSTNKRYLSIENIPRYLAGMSED